MVSVRIRKWFKRNYCTEVVKTVEVCGENGENGGGGGGSDVFRDEKISGGC